MTLKILNVVEHPDRVALEYALDFDPERDPSLPPTYHPQTFPSMGAASLPDALRDDTCTWDNLTLMLPVEERTSAELREECVALASALLAKHLAAQEARVVGADMVALAQAVVEPEGTV